MAGIGPQSGLVGNFIPVQAKDEPFEGRGIVPYAFQLTPINYSQAQGFDLSSLRISQVCTLYVDNTQNPAPLLLTHGASNAMVSIPAGGGGYIPTTSTQAGYFLNVATAKAPVAPINVSVTLYNYILPPSIFGSTVIIQSTTITADTLPNIFYNPGCQVAQRGATGAFASGAAGYTVGLDGWYMKGVGGANNLTWTQGGSIGVSPYSLQLAGAVNVTSAQISRKIIAQDIAPYAGQNVLLQFKIANASGAAFTPVITLKHPTAFNDFTALSNADYQSNVQTCQNGTTTQCAVVLALPLAFGNGCQLDINIPGLSAANQTISISDLDMSLAGTLPTGLYQTPPIPRLPSREVDQNACQFFFRYAPFNQRFTASAPNNTVASSVSWSPMFKTPVASGVIPNPEVTQTSQNYNTFGVLLLTSIGCQIQLTSAAAGDCWLLGYRFSLSAEP